jgi:hypothetical protein
MPTIRWRDETDRRFEAAAATEPGTIQRHTSTRRRELAENLSRFSAAGKGEEKQAAGNEP